MLERISPVVLPSQTLSCTLALPFFLVQRWRDSAELHRLRASELLGDEQAVGAHAISAQARHACETGKAATAVEGARRHEPAPTKRLGRPRRRLVQSGECERGCLRAAAGSYFLWGDKCEDICNISGS